MSAKMNKSCFFAKHELSSANDSLEHKVECDVTLYADGTQKTFGDVLERSRLKRLAQVTFKREQVSQRSPRRVL